MTIDTIVSQSPEGKTFVFSPEVQRQVDHMASRLGLTHSEFISMSIQYLHRASEVRQNGEVVVILRKNLSELRTFEPGEFQHAFGKLYLGVWYERLYQKVVDAVKSVL